MGFRFICPFVISVTMAIITLQIPSAESDCHQDCLAMQGEISNLKAELQKLKQNFDNINVQVGDQLKNLLSAQVSASIVNVKSEVTEVKQKLDQLQSSAVTNIRMTHPQSVAVWKGPGYTDAAGWVITSVQNWNSDKYPDQVARRLVQMHINGDWRTVSG